MKTDQMLEEFTLLDRTEAEATALFLRAVSDSYKNAVTAIGRIEKYRSRKGRDALLKKLGTNPACFGQSKCNKLPASASRASSRIRKETKGAVVLLPILYKQMFDARARRVDFERELSVAPIRFNSNSLNHTNSGESRVRSI